MHQAVRRTEALGDIAWVAGHGSSVPETRGELGGESVRPPQVDVEHVEAGRAERKEGVRSGAVIAAANVSVHAGRMTPQEVERP